MQYPVPLFSLCTKSLIAGARSPLFLNAQKKIISTGAEHCYVARCYQVVQNNRPFIFIHGHPGASNFTVVDLVTWPLNGSEAGVNLVLIQTSLLLLCKSSCSYALMLNRFHLHEKSREVCIKARSTPASLAFMAR